MIPVYNREEMIQDALNSALNQTYKNIEVIVSDNQSTDNTYDVIQDYARRDDRVKIFQNEQNLGPVRNWEAGLKQCSGKYVKIIWSDDFIDETYLEKAVPILESDEDIGFVYTATTLSDESFSHVVYELEATGKYPSNDFVKGILIGTSEVPVSAGCALFRLKDVQKNLILEVPNHKNLDFSRYGAGNDALIFLLTTLDYPYFYHFKEPLSTFRGHAGSFSIANDLTEYYFNAYVWFIENHDRATDKRTREIYYSRLLLFPKFRYMLKDVSFSIKFYYLTPLLIRYSTGKVYRTVKRMFTKNS